LKSGKLLFFQFAGASIITREFMGADLRLHLAYASQGIASRRPQIGVNFI
jgi:hypothetical protein